MSAIGTVTSFYPVVCTRDIAASLAFYRDLFGFEATFETDWYVSLRHTREPHAELALLDPDHPTVPEGQRHSAAGLLLNFEVADVDAEYDRLVRRGGLTPLLDLRSEEFGQRHFIVADPSGVAVDVITPIPAGAAYAGSFAEGADTTA
jgi:catechol 2,3-dioxygenase-like lactoylglutathione lyase family enzyme